MPEPGSEHVERHPHLPLTVCVIWSKTPEISESQILPLDRIKVCVVLKDPKSNEDETSLQILKALRKRQARVTVADRSLTRQPLRGRVRPGHTAPEPGSFWREGRVPREARGLTGTRREMKFTERVLYPALNTIHVKVSSDYFSLDCVGVSQD